MRSDKRIRNQESGIRKPLWLLLFWTFAAILPFSVALNPTPTMDLSLVRVLTPMMFLMWLLWSLANKSFHLDKRARFWLLAFFLLISTLSFFWATDTFRASRKVLFLLSLAPVYFVAFAATQNQFWSERLLKLLTWSGFVLACFGLILFVFQFTFGLDPTLKIISVHISPVFLGNIFSETVTNFPSWMVNVSGKTTLRTFGSFPDPHLFALYLNMLLPLIGLVYVRSDRKKIYLMVFLVVLLASLLSFSRAAYLSLIVAALFLFFSNQPVGIIKKYPLIVFSLLFATLLLVTVPNPLTARLHSSFDFQEGSNQGRLFMWQKAVDVTRENPLLGVGLGNFPRTIEPTSTYRDPIYAHNLFLDFSSETGIVNALLLLAIVLSPVIASFRKPSALAAALAISFVVFFVHSVFETPFYSVRVLPLFLILLAFNTD